MTHFWVLDSPRILILNRLLKCYRLLIHLLLPTSVYKSTYLLLTCNSTNSAICHSLSKTILQEYSTKSIQEFIASSVPDSLVTNIRLSQQADTFIAKTCADKKVAAYGVGKKKSRYDVGTPYLSVILLRLIHL